MSNVTRETIRLIKITVVMAFVITAFTWSHNAFAATLSVTPGTGVYTAGQTFTARVMVNTAGKNINAAEGTISFKPNELSVVGISKGSIFNLWTAEPAYSNAAGTITFSGGTPSGYTGSAGTVLTVSFRAKSAGAPRVSFASGAVLAADGRGTNVLTSMNGGSYTIIAQDIRPEPETIEYIAPANTPAAPRVTSTTHPDATAWYTAQTAELAWTLPADVTAIRTLLDKNSGSIPTKVYETPIDSIVINDLEEGVQYFHIQFKNADGWGRVAHQRLAVDSVAPTHFVISLPDDVDLSKPEQTLLLDTKDDISSVKRFLIQIDGAEPYEFIDDQEAHAVLLPALLPGHHTVVIESFDAAGNSLIDTFSFGILAFDKPQFTEYPNEISEEVIPVIKGITRPHAEIKVSITKVGSDTQEVTVKSSGSGEFIFIPEGRLSLGVYELSAVAIDQYGAQSEMSDTVRIAVQQPGYIRVGSLLIGVLSVLIPLAALALLSIFGLLYVVQKLRSLRSGVSKESHEALLMLRAEFEKIHSVVETQSAELVASRKTKKLTKAEEALIDTMNSALAIAQRNVEKEITDVENIVA